MLELYILNGCPYCRKVMKYLDEHKIEYQTFDISDRENLEALKRLGGIEQVPFLVDKIKKIELYESNDILEYLKTL